MTTEFEGRIAELRHTIDNIDAKLIELLGLRLRHCLEVGRLKREFDMPVMQPGRVTQVIERAVIAGQSHGLHPQFARDTWTMIINEACRLEDELNENAEFSNG